MPRNRNQPAVIVPLSDEQEMTFSGFGNLLTGDRDESLRSTLTRLFGSLERACEAWFDHRDELLAKDATAGRRPPAWWLLELDMDAPPAELQAAVLRQMGVLGDDEEQTLRGWAAMVPDLPDMSIAQPAGVRSTAEVPLSTNDIAGADPDTAEDSNATPVPARSAAEADSTEAVQAPEEIAVTPQILDLPRSSTRRRPPEFEGWEHHDAS